MSFDEDFDFSERFSQHICEIVPRALPTVQAPRVEDLKRNTDYILTVVIPYRDGRIRVAARSRRRKYMGRFGAEFTVRNRRPSGEPTEMAKMVQGYGDLFVYGFDSGFGLIECETCHGNHERLYPWFVGNTGILRQHIHDVGPFKTIRNKDHSSSLAVFRLADMPLGFMLVNDGIHLDEDSVWFECPHCWGYKGRPYGMPTTDDGEPGDGFGRKCLFCGQEWRSGRVGRLVAGDTNEG